MSGNNPGNMALVFLPQKRTILNLSAIWNVLLPSRGQNSFSSPISDSGQKRGNWKKKSVQIKEKELSYKTGQTKEKKPFPG